MKKYIKYWLLVTCMMLLTACGSEEAAQEEAVANESSYVSFVENNLSSFSGYSSDELSQYIEVYGSSLKDGEVDFIEGWLSNRDELGNYIGVNDYTVEKDGDDVTIDALVAYELRNCEVSIEFDKDGYVTSSVFNPVYTMGEKMSKAALNTVIGIVTVFVVLIFISWLISLFKYISVFEKWLADRKAAKAGNVSADVQESSKAVELQSEELADDEELVAVISAAIAAFEGTGTDGFTVRSIRKSTKWKRA